jgi:tetratricopeptide (TPR) repeat protein
MKRWMWFALAAGVMAAAAVTLVALPEGTEWTSDSPEAIAEFQAGIDAQMKIYLADSVRHFRRAVELDPDFVMANLSALESYARENPEKAEAMWAKVENADLDKLTMRERFFVERARARHEKRYEDETRLVDEYLEKLPNDPYVLHQKALMTWARGDLEEAERLNERLVEISPNWVIAYNQLGYISMMGSRFAEAEEHFKSYRFIAPDQANPHDSLGELYIIMGRYDEARETLNRALEIKPDFWAAYDHLAIMTAFSGDVEGTREVAERLRAAGGPDKQAFAIDCLAHSMELRNAEAWQQILDEADSDCVREFTDGFSTVTTHLAASKLGRWDLARSLEDEVAAIVNKVEGKSAWNSKDAMSLRGSLLHMRGVRQALEGDLEGAEETLRAADQELTFMEAGVGVYKLFNRMVLAEVLLAAGKDADAYGLMSKLESVNPVMASQFEDSGYRALGLDRI